jgi:hypothetical protein
MTMDAEWADPASPEHQTVRLRSWLAQNTGKLVGLSRIVCIAI